MDYRFERFSTAQPPTWKSLFKLLSWRGVLVLAVAAALAVAIFVAAASIFLLILPIALIAGLIGRLLLGNGKSAATARRQGGPELIEGEYEIVEIPGRERPTAGSGWGPRRS